jgi:membrane protease subunit HflC
MGHGHHHHGHHHHNHHHGPGAAPSSGGAEKWYLKRGRFIVAGLLVAIALLSACLTTVGPSEAVVLTRFGSPSRIVVEPGLSFKWPLPIENEIPVDLRLRTTSSGLQDVGTQDGLRLIVQAYVAWQVPRDGEHIRRFLRAVGNQPDMAAQQLRSFIGSSLQVVVSGYQLADLVNTDPSKVRLGDLESRLLERLREEALKVYGVSIHQVGLDRLTLPADTLNATVMRMQAERDTVAAEHQAEGERRAAEIVAAATRDSRIAVAKASADAAAIEATARAQAAEIYARTYRSNPNLYETLRSLDTLDALVSQNTRIILRTDAAPFRALVDGPQGRNALGGAGP